MSWVMPLPHQFHGHLAVNNNVEALHVYPGVRGRLKKRLVTNTVTLAKGTAVIIQPLALHQHRKQAYKITTYEKDNSQADSTLPESQRDITSSASYEVIINNPQQYFVFNEEHFQRSENNLFPDEGSPALAEVAQGRIGNCFLLAAVQSIIAQGEAGKAFIRSMMQQNNDGTVTVRLYHQQKPYFIKVNHSILFDKKGMLSRHRADWIHILEKAYAALGEKVKEKADASMSSVYSGGGISKKAMEVLTGLPAKAETLKIGALPWEIEKLFPTKHLEAIKDSLDLQKSHGHLGNTYHTMDNELKRQLSEVLFKHYQYENDPDQAYKKCKGLLEFYFAHCKDYQAILNSDISSVEKYQKLKLLSEGKNPEVNTTLGELYDNIQNLPYITLPGYYEPYHKDEIETFLKIRAALDSKSILTAGTQQKFPIQIPGLRNKHAYTILDAVERDGALFIKLRNPWGNTGRSYIKKNKTIIAIEDKKAAVFEIELKDFFKFFANYDISASTAEIFDREHQKENYLIQVHQHLDKFRIESNSSLNELSEAKTNTENTFDKLLTIELSQLNLLAASDIEHYNETLNRIGANTSTENDKAAQLKITSDIKAKYSHYFATEQQLSRAYNLLKYQWLKNTNQMNRYVKKDLIKHIGENSSYSELWVRLIWQMDILDINACFRADTLTKDALKLKSKMEDFQLELDTLTASNCSNFEKINYIAQCYSNIKLALNNILSRNSILNQLDYKLNGEMIDSFTSHLKNLESQMAPIKSLKYALQIQDVLFKELMNDTNKLVTKDKLPSEMAQKIQEETQKLINNPTPRTFEQYQKQVELFAKHTEPELQQLGEKMSKLKIVCENIYSLTKKIVRAPKGISTAFLKGVINRFKKPIKDYEMPKPKENRSFIRGLTMRAN